MKTLSFLLCMFVALGASSLAGEKVRKPARGGTQRIDLTTVLRLAGAQNLDVKLVAEKVALARAEHRIVRQQYFPWITAGTGFRGHQEAIQAVDGEMLDVEKSSFDLGVAVKAQLEVGETYYKSLSARQLVQAAGHALDAQRQAAIHAGALAYMDLVRANANVEVASDAVRISQDYETQVRRAVEAGIAFAGDAYRVQTQLEVNRLTERQAQETRRIAAARLAHVLHLDPSVNLVPEDSTPSPLKIVDLKQPLEGLVERALAQRAELRMTAAQREAALRTVDAAKYGPMFPSVGAHYSIGGLAGGPGSELAGFDESADYGIGLSWRIGPGGLFDSGRREASESRLRTTEIDGERLRDEIVRQVVEAHTRLHSLQSQLSMGERALESARKTLDLSRDRKEFGVGIVAETIQSEQDLTRARRDYLAILAEYNKAHFTLRWAVGSPSSRK